jgi:hypothetical protein
MITEEQLKQMMDKLEVLNNKVNVIGTMVKELYVKENQPIVSKPQSIPTGDKIPKNTINWEALSTIPDPKTIEIVTGMYKTNYPTVTSGQFKLLRDIASKHKIDISI